MLRILLACVSCVLSVWYKHYLFLFFFKVFYRQTWVRSYRRSGLLPNYFGHIIIIIIVLPSVIRISAVGSYKKNKNRLEWISFLFLIYVSWSNVQLGRGGRNRTSETKQVEKSRLMNRVANRTTERHRWSRGSAVTAADRARHPSGCGDDDANRAIHRRSLSRDIEFAENVDDQFDHVHSPLLRLETVRTKIQHQVAPLSRNHFSVHRNCSRSSVRINRTQKRLRRKGKLKLQEAQLSEIDLRPHMVDML